MGEVLVQSVDTEETAPDDEQTAPVQIDNMSVKEGENATIPTGETKQNVIEYPKNKKGEIDYVQDLNLF